MTTKLWAKSDQETVSMGQLLANIYKFETKENEQFILSTDWTNSIQTVIGIKQETVF